MDVRDCGGRETESVCVREDKVRECVLLSDLIHTQSCKISQIFPSRIS